MQLVESTTKINPTPFPATPQDRISADSPTLLAHYQIIRRNGAVVPFEPAKMGKVCRVTSYRQKGGKL